MAIALCAIAIQHQPQPNTPPTNTEPLSKTIEDAYRYENSPRFAKTIVQFVPATPKKTDKASPNRLADWYVIEATETEELIALADVHLYTVRRLKKFLIAALHKHHRFLLKGNFRF